MRSLIIILPILLLFMTGCESTPEVEEADVEEQGTEISGTEATEEETGAQAYGVDDAESGAMSALDDPQSQLYIRTIYFEYDSSEIQFDYRSIIEAHANYLVANPNTVITLEGHADERGSREYNLALGERRALTVRQQMVILGVDSSQIRTVSYGEERPALDGHDESSWSKNRRVEIIY